MCTFPRHVRRPARIPAFPEQTQGKSVGPNEQLGACRIPGGPRREREGRKQEAGFPFPVLSISEGHATVYRRCFGRIQFGTIQIFVANPLIRFNEQLFQRASRNETWLRRCGIEASLPSIQVGSWTAVRKEIIARWSITGGRNDRDQDLVEKRLVQHNALIPWLARVKYDRIPGNMTGLKHWPGRSLAREH